MKAWQEKSRHKTVKITTKHEIVFISLNVIMEDIF
jgi:hypothetical protein